MADLTSTVTVDTKEWIYVDSSSIQHEVTNAQTFTILISDDGATDVQWNFPTGNSVTTTDGLTLHFRPRVTTQNIALQTGTLSDTIPSDGFIQPVVSGELDIECPTTGKIQHWKISSLTPSDTDYASAGTIAAVWEDQWGNTMSWVAGMNVGQAA